MKCVWLVLFFGLGSAAQEPREEPTPSSCWLDFRALAARSPERAELPSWLESVHFVAAAARDGVALPATFRLRFRELRDLKKEMQLRLFFEDRKDMAPLVTGWSESGTQRFKRGPFGEGLGLPTSEAITFSMDGVDYIDVTVAGDPRNVRGVFLATLKTQEFQRALDFALPVVTLDPFGNLPPAVARIEDTKLLGRVRATLDSGSVKLTPREIESCTWEFELAAPPLMAVVTCEILNADPLAPVELFLNGRPLGAATVHLPDIADPGFLGHVRALDRDMHFRYSGWLRMQKALPGSTLVTGLNKISLQLNKESGPVAVRALSLQLKHASKTLDYKLAPTPP